MPQRDRWGFCALIEGSKDFLRRNPTRHSLPKQDDFPPGSRFVIKEWDVPLVQMPSGEWINWYGGAPTPYDIRGLKVDNNWDAESFEEWVSLIANSA